jgi:uncharacterized membrane protein
VKAYFFGSSTIYTGINPTKRSRRLVGLLTNNWLIIRKLNLISIIFLIIVKFIGILEKDFNYNNE